MPFFDYPEGEAPEEASESLIFLKDWDESRWKKLTDFTQHRRFSAGDTIIKMGDTDRTLQIILSGKLDVMIPSRSSDKHKKVNSIDAGSVVGEQAFVDGSPRSARVIASQPGELLELSYDNFQLFSAKEVELGRDILVDVARILSAKLRSLTKTIGKMS